MPLPSLEELIEDGTGPRRGRVPEKSLASNLIAEARPDEPEPGSHRALV